ncbi:hypothetical protein BC939DRAFT_440302 [Gamsiella multidivaricata]|uniref:uncharacterized protein n=1 Tax=Gamsiella multidivaricata TaxID=101098 RepID=UPI00221E7BD9|nr:uncharacterized protein BC939DRAFT_440302 [Gamsiella multidivaricata]KAI7829713.1 hypothetical protein BC939DRAFT_440302 [Gamsiella multidivaricata]
MSLEYEKVAREKELEVMKAKDLLDQQVELKKIRLKMEEARQKHERKLAEIEAESRSSIRKEELRTQEHMERLTLIESLTRGRGPFLELLSPPKRLSRSPPKDPKKSPSRLQVAHLRKN